MSFTKIKKIKQQSGFTIIELIIVIVIIAILATISSLSYEKILGNVRNSQRASNAKSLAEALEKYYDQNGEYPGCATMTNSDLSVVSSALKGLNVKVLTAPLADSGTNSLTCNDISSNEDDVLLYSKDKRASCLTGNSCGSFSLEYHDELNSTSIVKIASRRNAITGGSYAISIGGDGGERLISTAVLNDGSYISVGTTETPAFSVGPLDVLIVKHNSSGEILWTKTWGGLTVDIPDTIVSSSDGGFVIVGTSGSFDAVGGADGIILKFTADGTLSWSKTLGTSSADLIYSVTQTSDDGYAITGTSDSFGANQSMFIAKINSSGSMLWCNSFGSSNNENPNSIIQATNGMYLVVGQAKLSDDVKHAFLTLFDSDGGYLSNIVWAGTDIDSAQSVTQLTGGDIIVAGETSSFGSGAVDMFIARYDVNGNLIKNMVWGDEGLEFAVDLTSTADGGYFVSGEDRSSDDNSDAIYMKFDSNDNLVFSKIWFGADSEYLGDSVEDADQGFIMSGMTITTLGGVSQALLLKSSSDGTIKGCSASMCANANGYFAKNTTLESLVFTPNVSAAGLVLTDVVGTVNTVLPTITKIVYK